MVAAKLSHHFRRCAPGLKCKSTLDRIPKKKHGPLPEEEDIEGYGMYAEIGWDPAKSLKILLWTLIPFLVFAIFWVVYVNHQDLQNALMLATLGIATLGYMVVVDYSSAR